MMLCITGYRGRFTGTMGHRSSVVAMWKIPVGYHRTLRRQLKVRRGPLKQRPRRPWAIADNRFAVQKWKDTGTSSHLRNPSHNGDQDDLSRSFRSPTRRWADGVSHALRERGYMGRERGYGSTAEVVSSRVVLCLLHDVEP